MGTSPSELNMSEPATWATVYDGRYRYCASFKNLSPAITYFYSIPGTSSIFSFQTLSSTEHFKFAVIGDTRSGDDYHRAVIAVMEKYKFSFYFNTGDLVWKDDLDEWDPFFEIEQPLLSSHFFFPVEGNHDVSGEGIPYSKIFYYPEEVTPTGSYYSFWVGKNFFLIASTEKPFTSDSPQYHWLENQLKNAEKRGAIHKFMFHHRPPFSSGPHGVTEDQGEEAAASILAPLAITYGVTVVFNGHEHLYERNYKDGVYFITTGGGGATPAFICEKGIDPYSQYCEPNADLEHFHFVLVDVGTTYVELKAITMHNEVIDDLVIGKKSATGQKEKSTGCSCRESGGSTTEGVILLIFVGAIYFTFRLKKSERR